MQITKYLLKGLGRTLKLANGTQFSYAGPWSNVISAQVIDSWHVGDFMSADYTVAVDRNTGDKEIIKCLVVAGPTNASVTIYGRTGLSTPIINIQATVDNSKVSIIASPLQGACKVIFSANYYQTLNPIVTT